MMLATTLMALPREDEGLAPLDATTFPAFYAEALPRIYGYFLHRCGGSVAVAEDLTQEAFVAAVAELRGGRRVDAPLPWLYGIARHKLVDHYRRESRLGRTLSSLTVTELSDGDRSGVERERTSLALAAVPAAQRAVLVLCYLDGFTAAEIATALGKSRAAVHSLLERGRASFKRAYGADA